MTFRNANFDVIVFASCDLWGGGRHVPRFEDSALKRNGGIGGTNKTPPYNPIQFENVMVDSSS